MLYQHMRAADNRCALQVASGGRVATVLLATRNSQLATFLLLSLFAASAQGQDIVTVPANPVAGVPFVVKVTISACVNHVTTAVNGTNIDITLHFEEACIATPVPVTLDVPVGPLSAGTYTIRLLSGEDGSLIESEPIVITADIPALDPRILAILAGALMVIAFLRMK
jgi:hypothetical protein